MALRNETQPKFVYLAGRPLISRHAPDFRGLNLHQLRPLRAKNRPDFRNEAKIARLISISAAPIQIRPKGCRCLNLNLFWNWSRQLELRCPVTCQRRQPCDVFGAKEILSSRHLRS